MRSTHSYVPSTQTHFWLWPLCDLIYAALGPAGKPCGSEELGGAPLGLEDIGGSIGWSVARWGVWVRLASNWNCFKLRKFKLHGARGTWTGTEIKTETKAKTKRIECSWSLNFWLTYWTHGAQQVWPVPLAAAPKIRDPGTGTGTGTGTCHVQSCPLYVLAGCIYQAERELRVKPKLPDKPKSKPKARSKARAWFVDQNQNQDRKWPKSARQQNQIQLLRVFS